MVKEQWPTCRVVWIAPHIYKKGKCRDAVSQ